VVDGADDDLWDGHRPVRQVPGTIFVWILGLLALLVALGWLIEFAAARNAGSNEYVIAGAAPVPVDAVASTPPSAGATSTGGTAPAPTAAVTTKPPNAADATGTTSVQVASAWVDNVADRTGIPARALTAYADAQLATNATRPGCHLSWVMLAGIGSVESGHGSHAGTTLLPDGMTSQPILGPALDGTHGNKAVPATAAGIRLDGDLRWDHAVGPMQFLPSTWTHWGVSADGGVPNPSDIDDAALTAADYLCGSNRDLATPTGWRAALAAYNTPDSYAVKVTKTANKYATASLG
jgi:membrane-bound lytic murein transglycosylase B